MDTFGTKVKRSGKEFGDHGLQFLTDTKVAGESFVSFVQDEAKDWGEYLRNRVQNIESQGRGLLGSSSPRDNIWVHLDSLIGKVSGRPQPLDKEVFEEEPEVIQAASETTEQSETEETSSDESEVATEEALVEETEDTAAPLDSKN